VLQVRVARTLEEPLCLVLHEQQNVETPMDPRLTRCLLRVSTATGVAAIALLAVGAADGTALPDSAPDLAADHSQAGNAEGNSKSFRDPLGDVTCCTRDLTDIRVRNSDAGTISFDAHFDASVEGEGDDDDLGLLLHTDRNPATGQPGSDYLIGAQIYPGGVDDVTFSRLEAGQYRQRSAEGVYMSVVDNHIRISLDRHLLGDTDGFAFVFQLWEVTSFGGNYLEQAPNQGAGPWTFPVKIAVSRLRPVLSTEPRPPRAGRRFRARLALRVTGTHSLLASGRVSCVASIEGVRLRSFIAAFVRRHAVCAWRLPPAAEGKTLRGSVSVAVTSYSRVTRRVVVKVARSR